MKNFFVYFLFFSLFFNYGNMLNPPKLVALTFDDGPSRYTDEILDYLYSENVKATYFVMGNKIKNKELTLIKMYCYGNEIGNHTYDHAFLPSLKDEEIENQIIKTNNLIFQTTGYSPIYLRPSYGTINNKIKNNTNMEIVLWDIDTKDWKIKNSNTVYKKIIRQIKNEDIILFHDTYKRTIRTLKLIVPELKKKGYTFVTIKELREYQSLAEF